MRFREIESLAEFDAAATVSTSMHGWRVQSVDLSSRSEDLRRLDPHEAIFLGCTIERETAQHLRDHGALLLPAMPHVPFNPYRSGLYTADELYDRVRDGGYEATLDARAYAWSTEHPDHDVARTLASALHDQAIDDALRDALHPGLGGPLVGVMGGHALRRGDAEYARSALLGRALARAGFVVATGGGPGAMEAANLGARLAEAGNHVLDDALDRLAPVPSFQPSVAKWALAALDLLERHHDARSTLGVPTWFYGHEPPNLFATHIAKYFQNSVREAVLLSRCDGGIVFLPGAGGTVQEIFQAACEAYYAEPSTLRPLVLVGRTYWSERLPAWGLLQRLGEGRLMAERIACVEDPTDAVELLARWRPVTGPSST